MNGALVQLARTFDWQSKGQRFDSAMLHFFSLSFDIRVLLDSWLSCRKKNMRGWDNEVYGR